MNNQGVNNSLTLLLIYITLYPWYKAGLATGIGSVFFLLLGIFIFYFSLRDNFSKFNSILYFFVITTILLNIFSYFNPTFRNLNKEDLEYLEFNNLLIESDNVKKSKVLADNISHVIKESETNPREAIALFFHYKNIYIDKYGNKDSDKIVKFFNECEQRILIKSNFFPSLFIADSDYFQRLFFFILNFFLCIFIYNSIQTREQCRKVFQFLFINTIILAVVGIYQKYTQRWNDDFIEILGVWNAPEPRYYFSTFSYKNHWSCFALVGIFSGIFITYEYIKRSGHLLLRSPIFLLYLISVFISVFTIFYSGSRSGSFLIILFFISFFLINLYSNKFKNKFLYIIFFVISFASIFSFFAFSNVTKEMKTNTINQAKSYKQGNLPLRVHLWKDAIRQIHGNIWFGYGYGAYTPSNPIYQSKIVREQRSVGLENAHEKYVPLVAHVHNDILEFFLEFGLIGFFALMTPWLILFSKSKIRTNSSLSRIFLVIVSILFVYFVIDFPSRTPATMAIVSFFYGTTLKYIYLRQSLVK